ncbi:MAG: class I SAM-dependent methyltransferase [Gammaproteobacteria bacterium]
MIDKLKTMWDQRKQREDLYSTAAYWDSKARQHEGHAVSMWPNNHLNDLYHREQLGFIMNIIPEVKGKAMLEIGCGTGRISRWFASLGATVTGIDFSEGALKIARQQTQGENPGYRHLSMFEINDSNAFDIVVSWGSITVACRNRGELAQLMEKLFEALKPGGEILLLEPIHQGFLHRVLNMDKNEFIAVMREAGFEIQFVRSLHFWPMRLCLSYFTLPKILTVSLYHLGQFIMRIPGFNGMGDYQAIYAVRKQ